MEKPKQPEQVKIELKAPDIHIRVMCTTKCGGFSHDIVCMKDELRKAWKDERLKFDRCLADAMTPVTYMEIPGLSDHVKTTPFLLNFTAKNGSFNYVTEESITLTDVEGKLKEALSNISTLANMKH